jgi:hypothetical protein
MGEAAIGCGERCERGKRKEAFLSVPELRLSVEPLSSRGPAATAKANDAAGRVGGDRFPSAATSAFQDR